MWIFVDICSHLLISFLYLLIIVYICWYLLIFAIISLFTDIYLYLFRFFFMWWYLFIFGDRATQSQRLAVHDPKVYPEVYQKYTPKYTQKCWGRPGLIQDVFRTRSDCSCLLLFVDIVHSCWCLLISVYIYLYLLLFVTCCYLFIFVYIY